MQNAIKTHPRPICRICGGSGVYLYQNLTDRLFGVPGEWSLRTCGNPECGLLWLDPMPETGDVGKLYETYYTHEVREGRSLAKRIYRRAIDGYLRRRYGYDKAIPRAAFDGLLGALLYLHPGARAEADARVMSLPAKPGGRLLEVGFGNAQTLRRMQLLGWDVQGVEFDPVAVNNARASGLNVHLGDLASQDFPESSFDAVVSSHVIEHLPDPEGFLYECCRLLKPGGTLVAYAPNSRSFGHRIFGRNWLHLDAPRHLYSFNANNLTTLAEKAGFLDVSCQSTVRGGGALVASIYLIRHPRISIPLGKASRLLEEAAHYLSWAACKVDKDLGEELLLVARKAG